MRCTIASTASHRIESKQTKRLKYISRFEIEIEDCDYLPCAFWSASINRNTANMHRTPLRNRRIYWKRLR